MNGNRIQIKRKQFENYRQDALASPKGLVYDKNSIIVSRLFLAKGANAMSEKDVTIKVES